VDALGTPFVEGRLRNEPMEIEIATSCAHCGIPIHIVVNDRSEVRVRESGAQPRVFIPHIEWESFRKATIIDDF
jgi:hypothetical protein